MISNWARCFQLGSKPSFSVLKATSSLAQIIRPKVISRPVSLSSLLNQNMSHSLYIDETPEEVKNAKGLHLLTFGTPNGQKVQIFLEELKAVYDINWTTTIIDIRANKQKEEWFLRLNPNGRIPVLVDNNQSPPFPVFETSAELLYLLDTYDKDKQFGFSSALEKSQLEQWLIFWHGSGAPYQGQVNHFAKFAQEKIPYAIERFRNETLRVYGVLEIHLSGKFTGLPRDYLAGEGKGKYSIADIGTWPWVKGYAFSGFTEEDIDQFPHLRKWIERIAERPAVKKGVDEKYLTS